MINILVPMAGKSIFFSESEFHFPKPLIEIGSKTMIEHVIANLSSADSEVQFIFVVSSGDCRKFHLDSTLNIITDHHCRLIKLDKETKGAACSALMAVSHIDNDAPMIIANSDQLFDLPLADLLRGFGDADAGAVTFDSVHPRWSYVRLDAQGLVIEAAEKRPISRHAIAGLYYFRRGSDFVTAAKRSIQKNASINGAFFIAPTLNELVLLGKSIRTVSVDADRYHTFYTPEKIKDYESSLQQRVCHRDSK